jgi:hypothetical protein
VRRDTIFTQRKHPAQSLASARRNAFKRAIAFRRLESDSLDAIRRFRNLAISALSLDTHDQFSALDWAHRWKGPSVMKSSAFTALLLSLLVAGCASGGSTGHVAPTSSSNSSSNHRLIKYSVPVVTSRAVQAAGNRASAARHTQNSIGNIPSILAIIDLIDAPLFGVSQINLAIVGVSALQGDVATPIVEYNSEVVINVLDYKSSALALGSASIPAQAYDGLQVVIDPSQSTVVTTDGQTYPLQFGSMQNGTFVPSAAGVAALNFPLAFDGSTGSVSLLVDFSALRSIRNVGGTYAVIPRFGGVPQSNAAVIAGSLVSANGTPVQGATAVVTDASGNLVGAAPSDENGNFEVHAIAAGTYSVSIENSYTTDAGMVVLASDGRTDTLPAVQVSVPAGYELDLGQISD